MSKDAAVYDAVTASIVAAMQAGQVPWVRPWNAAGGAFGLPVNAITRRPFSGCNVLALWASAMARGFTSQAWVTFLDAKNAGAMVPKGGTAVVFMAPIFERNADGTKGRIKFRVPRLSYRWNVDQLYDIEDGAVARIRAGLEPDAPVSPVATILGCETTVASTGAEIRHSGNQAFYRPSEDTITMPPRDTFLGTTEYYGTLFHELGHWTGHGSRLARLDDQSRFGSPEYASEELVAELCAAFVCARHGIEHVTQAAAYLQSWIKALQDDSRHIATAASMAQKAADYICKGSAAVSSAPEVIEDDVTAEAA